MFRTALAAAAVLAAVPSLATAQSVTDDVDVSVDTVTPSASGQCLMKGWVVTVRRSDQYQPGSAIAVDVPCAAGGGSQGYYFDENAVAGRNKTVSILLSHGRVLSWRIINAG